MGRKRGSTTQDKGANKKSQQKRSKKGFFSGIREFARGVRSELRKVNWPNREQLRQSTAVVMVIVVTLGIYVAAWDFVFQNIVRLVFLR